MVGWLYKKIQLDRWRWITCQQLAIGGNPLVSFTSFTNHNFAEFSDTHFQPIIFVAPHFKNLHKVQKGHQSK